MKKLLLFGGIGLIAYLYFSKKNFINSTIWNFEGLNFNLKRKKILVKLSVLNPTGQSVTIKSIVGNLILNSNIIATIESFIQQKIEPNNKTFITLDLVPAGVGIFSQAKVIIQALLEKKKIKGKKLSAIFQGSANVEGVTVPIDIKLMS